MSCQIGRNIGRRLDGFAYLAQIETVSTTEPWKKAVSSEMAKIQCLCCMKRVPLREERRTSSFSGSLEQALDEGFEFIMVGQGQDETEGGEWGYEHEFAPSLLLARLSKEEITVGFQFDAGFRRILYHASNVGPPCLAPLRLQGRTHLRSQDSWRSTERRWRACG